MSRKRTLKKLQKRQESVLAQLEELYLRGADDEFLALAAEEIKDRAGFPLAAEWAEVAGRVLLQSLGRADLGRLERLLPSLRRGGPLLPAMVLAEAVLDLAAGRLDTARSRLAALAADGGETATAFPRDLLAALQSLAQDRPDSRWPLDDPYLQAAGQLFRSLQSLEAQAFAPTVTGREDLARRLDALRSAASALSAPLADTGELHRLLDSAGRCLSLLADLSVLDEKLSRLPESDHSSSSQLVASWLRGPGPLLAATLTVAGPALLAPLQHTVRLRWRAVLERVAAREGSPGLAALCAAADPRLIACDVSLPGGVQAGLASLRQGAQVRQLLAGRQYLELAALLQARSQTESDSGALAALWSLELWVIQHRDAEDADEDEDGWLAEPPPDPPARQALVRLRGMAGEIGRRFPVEQRAGVARRLRDELFDLCEQIVLGESVARAALALLEHQPGDIGLLIAGVAGAVADGDAKTLRAFKERLPHGKVQEAQENSLVVARRMMIQVAREDPSTVVRSLELLQPLFAGSVWPEIVALVARTMSRSFAMVLSAALFKTALEGHRVGDRPFTEIRRELDRLRPALAGAPGFAAMELAFDYLSPGSPPEKRLQRFMADNPGLEGVLTAFRLLEASAPPFFRLQERASRARGKLAREVIERLDERWELWEPAVDSLVLFAGEDNMPRLAEKIQQVLASPGLPPAGRQRLEQALQTVQRMLKKPTPPRTIRKKKPRGRRSGTPQLRLEV